MRKSTNSQLSLQKAVWAENQKLLEMIVKFELKKHPDHLVEFDELVSIGFMALVKLYSHSNRQHNQSYKGQAIRWAIANEMRIRRRWTTQKDDPEEQGVIGFSLEGICREHNRPFIEIVPSTQAETIEIVEEAEQAELLREVIKALPEKSQAIITGWLYENKKIKELASQMKLSSSRVSRIFRGSFPVIREKLVSNGF